MVNSSAEGKLLTAMMLLEMCERTDDPTMLDKIASAHSYLQSAWSELRGGCDVQPVSDNALEFVSHIHADAAIKDASNQRFL